MAKISILWKRLESSYLTYAYTISYLNFSFCTLLQRVTSSSPAVVALAAVEANFSATPPGVEAWAM